MAAEIRRQQSASPVATAADSMKRKRPTAWAGKGAAVAAATALLLGPSPVSAARSFQGNASVFQLETLSNGSCSFMSWPSLANSHYSTMLRANSSLCGRCVQVDCTDRRCGNGTSTVVYVLDHNQSTDGSNATAFDLQLAPLAYQELTGSSNDTSVPVRWRFVDCPLPNGDTGSSANATELLVSVCASASSNRKWLALQPVNDTIGVSKLWVDNRPARLLATPAYFFNATDPRGEFGSRLVTVSIQTRLGRLFTRRTRIKAGSCVHFKLADEDASGSGSAGSRVSSSGSASTDSGSDDDDHSDGDDGSASMPVSHDGSHTSGSGSAVVDTDSDSGPLVFDTNSLSPIPTRSPPTSPPSTQPTVQRVPSTSRVPSTVPPPPPSIKDTEKPPTKTPSPSPSPSPSPPMRPQDPDTDTDRDPRTTSPPPPTATPKTIDNSNSPPRSTRGRGDPPEIRTTTTVFTSPIFVGLLLGTVGFIGAVVAYRAKTKQEQMLERSPRGGNTSRAMYADAATLGRNMGAL